MADGADPEQRLRFQATLLDAVGEALLATDLQSRVTYWNQAAASMYGWSREEATGRCLVDLVGPNHPLAENAADCVHAGERCAASLPALRRDGTSFHALITATPVTDGTGKVTGVVQVASDISERLRTEEALLEQAELLDLAHDAIVVWDADTRIRFWSRGAERTYGWRADEVVGTEIHQLLRTEFPESFDAVQEQVRRNASWEGLLTHARRDGTKILVTSRWALRKGGVPAVLQIDRDVTEHMHAERELHRSQCQLNAAQRLSSTGSWDRDLRTGSVRWSEELFNMLGIDEDVEPTADLLLEVVHPDDRPLAAAIRQRALVTGREQGQIRIVRMNDGSVRTLHVVVEATFDASGVPVHLMATTQDVTERMRLEGELERQAFHDALTGLPNRVLLADRVDHALRRRRRTDERFSLLFVDLDDFKVVNDSLGHSAGDELLATLARRLLSVVRPSDTVARLGGDEFAVLLEGADQLAAELAAGRILTEIGQPTLVQDRQVFVHACIGIAVAGGQASSDELLRSADAAMHAAKGDGKNQYRVFQASMHTAARRRLELRVELQRAVEQGEFVVHYQPIVRLETGTIIGFEALARWAHPRAGIVSPAEFIPIAEDSGLIVRIGRSILREAASWLQKLGRPQLTLSVNLSPRQLTEPHLVDHVEEALHDAAFDPRRLVVEITENVLVDKGDAVVAQLGRLRDRGVRVALDDFGTGYSSLSHLRSLPVDILKIDRAFVSGMTKQVEDAAVARAVVTLGEALGFSTVAEGIETAEQARELVSLGSYCGQGYLFSPPLEGADAERALCGGIEGGTLSPFMPPCRPPPPRAHRGPKTGRRRPLH